MLPEEDEMGYLRVKNKLNEIRCKANAANAFSIMIYARRMSRYS